jgi:hypothetical protein
VHDPACDLDEGFDFPARALVRPRERDDGRVGVEHAHVGHISARIVLGDRLGNEADAAATRNEREDLLDAGGLGGDAAGQSVALLFGQPPYRRAVDHRIDDEALGAKIGVDD